MDNHFNILNKIDCSKIVSKKDGLTYLSWADAWELVCKNFPDAKYEVVKNDNGLPYFSDNSGAMVYTKVTIAKITHERLFSFKFNSNLVVGSTIGKWQLQLILYA